MKLSQLKKMKMPEKGQELDLSELDKEGSPADDSQDATEEGSPEEEANESPAEESKELDAIPDDLLLAEVKKRGLMSQLQDDDSAPQDPNA